MASLRFVGCASALLAAGAAVGCGPAGPTPLAVAPSSTTPTTTVPSPPQLSDVVAFRFEASAELDDGQLIVEPAPTADRPALAPARAMTLFRSDVAVMGYWPMVIGYGLVSVDPSLTANANIHPLHKTLAWVGFARSSGVSNCPAMISATTAPTAAAPTPNYTAVIIAAAADVDSYRSRESTCGNPPTGPTVTRSPQAISARWEQVSLLDGRLTYRYLAPSCVPRPEAGVQSGGNVRTGEYTIAVQLAVPYGTNCPLTWLSDTISLVPPAPGAPPQPTTFHLAHAPTGPIDVATGSPPG